ncbi:MAG TPA: type II toxin-antitoxin system HicB family antitoxin [Planctomycetota bacterium]|nr:type II toxin-antitoxin system HicB family antitoxin [Planctomycetota bacterium]
MRKYRIEIQWSPDDGVFVASVPKLPGCVAHGKSRRSAIRNTMVAVRLWVKTAREFGDLIPQGS